MSDTPEQRRQPQQGGGGSLVPHQPVELERAEALGLAGVVLHPGSFTTSSEEAGLERITAALESQYRFEDNAFAFGQAQYDRDRVQGIAQRFAISGGLGWTVVDDPGLRIALKGGPAYRYTDYRTAPNERVLTGLAALDGRWRIATGVTLTQHAETFVAAQNSTFASTTALDTSILGPLKARFSYTLDYQTQPPAGAVDLNTLSRASLVYDF